MDQDGPGCPPLRDWKPPPQKKKGHCALSSQELKALPGGSGHPPCSFFWGAGWSGSGTFLSFLWFPKECVRVARSHLSCGFPPDLPGQFFVLPTAEVKKSTHIARSPLFIGIRPARLVTLCPSFARGPKNFARLALPTFAPNAAANQSPSCSPGNLLLLLPRNAANKDHPACPVTFFGYNKGRNRPVTFYSQEKSAGTPGHLVFLFYT